MTISYPKDNPQGKHDLLSLCQWPPPSSIEESEKNLLFSNEIELLKAIDKEYKFSDKRFQLITSLYTYPDAPSIKKGHPIAHPLLFIGYISAKTIQPCSTKLEKCKIGVKILQSNMHPKDMTKSKNFKLLMQTLSREKLWGVLACDKKRRLAFFEPNDYAAIANGEASSKGEFCALCHFGQKDDIRQELLSSSSSIISQKEKKEETFPTTPPGTPPPLEPGDWIPTTPPLDGEHNVEEDTNMMWGAQDSSTDNNETTMMWGADTSNDNDTTMWTGDSMGNNSSETPFGGMWNPDMSSNGLSESATTAMCTVIGDNNNSNGDDSGTFHANKGAADADNFYSNLTRELGTRADSILFHMRAFNGWVKATQISELDPKTSTSKQRGGKRKRNQNSRGNPIRVLDLACGKGGDLGKWILHKRGIENYVGVDVARGSLVDAAKRAIKISKGRNASNLPRATFVCADLGENVLARPDKEKLLTWIMNSGMEKTINGGGDEAVPTFEMLGGGGIAPNERFDVVSIQFAIHYMMQTEDRARRFFQTVGDLLDVGGNLIATTVDARVVLDKLMGLGLDVSSSEAIRETIKEPVDVNMGGSVCRLRFEPQTLDKIFIQKKRFGLEYAFTLVEGEDHSAGVGEAVDLPEWLIPIPVLEQLAEEVGLKLESYENFHDFYDKRKDPYVFPVVHNALYNMKVLNKDGTISEQEFDVSRVYVAVRFTKVREVTPRKSEPKNEKKDKGMFLALAMKKARAKAGPEKWKDLPSEEKSRLINLELEQM